MALRGDQRIDLHEWEKRIGPTAADFRRRQIVCARTAPILAIAEFVCLIVGATSWFPLFVIGLLPIPYILWCAEGIVRFQVKADREARRFYWGNEVDRRVVPTATLAGFDNWDRAMRTLRNRKS